MFFFAVHFKNIQVGDGMVLTRKQNVLLSNKNCQKKILSPPPPIIRNFTVHNGNSDLNVMLDIQFL